MGRAKVADDLQPGCVVLFAPRCSDATLQAGGALSLMRDGLSWIAVGDFEDRTEDAVQLMKLGAADVVAESRGFESILGAVVAALPVRRDKAADTEDRQTVEARRKISELSRREREVLQGLLAGRTNKAIALDLALSPRTIETHRAHVMDKLGVGTLADLLKLASTAGTNPSAGRKDTRSY
mgnify:CR=1 FL=1